MQYDRKHKAYHEAGHAVVGIALGVRIGRVTINPGEWNGETYHARVWSEGPWRNPLRFAVVSLAGVVAQGRYMRNYSVAAMAGGRDDYRQARECLAFLNSSDAISELERVTQFERVTVKVVNKLWPVIRSFALALLAGSGDMEAEEVNRRIDTLLAEDDYDDVLAEVNTHEIRTLARCRPAHENTHADDLHAS